jgi:hypothetical protein
VHPYLLLLCKMTFSSSNWVGQALPLRIIVEWAGSAVTQN